MMRPALLVLCSWLPSVLVACGGSKAPAEEPTSAASQPEAPSAVEPESGEAEAEAEASSESAAEPIPTKCARAQGACTPNSKFVQKLCSASYPGVALYLFANGSPWTRGYLTGKVKAWNASGGVSADGFLEFDEEVIVLQERKADQGGMQVSGAGTSYDVLRWDGTCATLSEGELTLNKPPSPKAARVEWRFLDDNVQEALRSDEALSKLVSERKKECKGATSGDVSQKCVKADTKLSNSIIGYVRKGGTIPVPDKLP
jgi:hypothetical protein